MPTRQTPAKKHSLEILVTVLCLAYATQQFLPSLINEALAYSLSSYKWGDTNISASFMPDGTDITGYPSSTLFAMLNPKYPTATWQREFARALQTWASVSPLNFRFVADDGTKTLSLGLGQNDPRFGDIRLGATPLSGALASTVYPGIQSNPWSTTDTSPGNITLSTNYSFNIGSTYDLYSILLHESGHALGLEHSTSGTVMYGTYAGVKTALTADDIAGIHAKYGPRLPDSYDAAATNESFATASSLGILPISLSISGDLTTSTDMDYYQFTVPSGPENTLTVSCLTKQHSLLSPRLKIFNSSLALLKDVQAPSYNSDAVLVLNGVTAGQVLYIVVDRSTTAGIFGIGSYELKFDLTFTTSPPPDTTSPTASIVSPTSGTTVSGTVNATASASDDTGVTQVDFYLDSSMKFSDTSSPYEMSWDSKTLGNGSHSLMAKASDAAGNIGTSTTVTVNVSNASIDTTPPAVSITNPVNGYQIPPRTNVVNIQASAQDNVGVTKVELYIDGVLKTTLTTSPYTANLNVKKLATGPHTITAKAYDGAGNTASASITVYK